jgi:uncharacterized protein YkwD
MLKIIRIQNLYQNFWQVAVLSGVLFASLNASAGRRYPLNSTPPEISNTTLCTDRVTESDSDEASNEKSSSPSIREDLKDKREDFCKLTNSIREWHLSRTLVLDSDLSDVAQNEAKSIFEASKDQENLSNEKFVDKKELEQRLEAKGIEADVFGYHVAKDDEDDAHDIVRTSLSDSMARKQLLNHSFRKIGVGFYRGVWISLFTN